MLSKEGLDLYEEWKQTPRDEKKQKSGCVIRAVQSAMRAQATEDEWDLRFQQIGLLRATTGIWRNMWGSARDEMIRQEYQQEWVNLVELVETLRDRPTPLGRAIASYSSEWIQGDIGEIFGLLAGRKKVLLATPHHLCHIEKVPLIPYLVSVSDKGYQPIPLEPRDQIRDLFVFSPQS
jgi:hypothetical protein